MDFSNLSDRERLIAEQAVEALRAVDRAADAAPHGHGLARVEESVQDHGFALMRAMIASAADARPEGQKRGPASAVAPAAAAAPSTRPARRARS